MKKILLFLSIALTLSLASCSTASKMARAERKAAYARQVQAGLTAGKYTIAVDWMRPLRGPARHVNGNYSLTIDGEVVHSYLPYIGEVYRAVYGESKGLRIEEATMRDYAATRTADDCTRIEFTIVNEEDTYRYVLTIFAGGKALIDVFARDRDSISFDGEVVASD